MVPRTSTSSNMKTHNRHQAQRGTEQTRDRVGVPFCLCIYLVYSGRTHASPEKQRKHEYIQNVCGAKTFPGGGATAPWNISAKTLSVHFVPIYNDRLYWILIYKRSLNFGTEWYVSSDDLQHGTWPSSKTHPYLVKYQSGREHNPRLVSVSELKRGLYSRHGQSGIHMYYRK